MARFYRNDLGILLRNPATGTSISAVPTGQYHLLRGSTDILYRWLIIKRRGREHHWHLLMRVKNARCTAKSRTVPHVEEF